MEALLYELSELRHVERVVFESRGAADDRADIDLVRALRFRRLVGRHVKVEHIAGPAEPLLWIPDIVCGSLGDHMRGQPAYLRRIDHQTYIVP